MYEITIQITEILANIIANIGAICILIIGAVIANKYK